MFIHERLGQVVSNPRHSQDTEVVKGSPGKESAVIVNHSFRAAGIVWYFEIRWGSLWFGRIMQKDWVQTAFVESTTIKTYQNYIVWLRRTQQSQSMTLRLVFLHWETGLDCLLSIIKAIQWTCEASDNIKITAFSYPIYVRINKAFI